MRNSFETRGVLKWLLPKHKSTLVQIAVLIALAIGYLSAAPNFRWQSECNSTPYGADFLQEWVAAKLIVSGEADAIYQDKFIAAQHDSVVTGFDWNSNQYFPSVYPPAHYLLFSPFGLLPYRWAVVLWLFVLLACVGGAIRTIESILKEAIQRSGSGWQASGFRVYLWLAVLLFPSLLFSITLGQKSILWLFVLCTTILWVMRAKDFRAGLMFGLLSIKPTLFFFLPLVMLQRRRWRFLVGAGVTTCLIWGTALVALPFSTFVAFADSLRSVGTFAENGGYRIDWSCNLMTMAYSLPPELVAWGKLALCVPLAVYVLYSVGTSRYAIDSPDFWLMVLCSTAILSPHFYHYDLCILLVPMLWLAVTDMRRCVAIYTVLAIGVSIAGDLQELLGIPILPLLLIGILCETGLRQRIPAKVHAPSPDPRFV